MSDGVQVYEGDDAECQIGAISGWSPTPEQRARYCQLIIDRRVKALREEMEREHTAYLTEAKRALRELVEDKTLSIEYLELRVQQLARANESMLRLFSQIIYQLDDQGKDLRTTLMEAGQWLDGQDPHAKRISGETGTSNSSFFHVYPHNLNHDGLA
jgi:hypothetical protein